LNRLPPPDVLEWFQRIYTTEEMIMLIKQSYRLKQKKTDEDDKIYEKWMFKNYGDVKLVKKIKRMDALERARRMGL
ncbi:TPA: hypothetical protein ACRBVW_001798, partial [Streptococcus pyogenes]